MHQIEEILYPDLQAQRPAGICSRCGGVVYAPTRHCPRCRRDKL